MLPQTFADGTSNTLLFVEKYARCGEGGSVWGRSDPDFWMPAFAVWTMGRFQVRPSGSECNPRRASTPFSAGLHAALADGSVRRLSGAMSQPTWWAACTPDGGEVLAGDW